MTTIDARAPNDDLPVGMPTGSRARRDSPGRLLPELRRAELEGVLGASLVDTMRAHGALAPRARIDRTR